MSDYDIALSVDQSMINRLVGEMFARPGLQDSLFSGRREISFAGVSTTVGWQVQEPPVVALTPPTAEQWHNAVKADSSTAQPEAHALIVTFPALEVSRVETAGTSDSQRIALDVICTVTTKEEGRLRISPLAVAVDLSQASAIDRLLYKLLIIPETLRMAGALLSDQQLPDLYIRDIRFGPLVLGVGFGRIVGVANLLGKPEPAGVALESFPEGAFYMLLSPEAVQQIAMDGLQTLRGKSDQVSGSQMFLVGNIAYVATAHITDVVAQVDPSELSSLNLQVSVAIEASAGFDALAPPIPTIPSVDPIRELGKKIADAFSSY